MNSVIHLLNNWGLILLQEALIKSLRSSQEVDLALVVLAEEAVSDQGGSLVPFLGGNGVLKVVSPLRGTGASCFGCEP